MEIAPHVRRLVRAAEADAQLCLIDGLELRRPSILELKIRGPRHYGHNDFRVAFGLTIPVDPGDGFGWDRYLGLVKAAPYPILAGAQR